MKKVIVSLLALTTVGLGLAIPLQAKAQSFNINLNEGRLSEVEFGRHHEFEVLYRNYFGNVRFAGIYRDYYEAERAARRLERDGFRAWVERI